MKDIIEIKELIITEKSISAEIVFPKRLERYFTTNILYLKYNSKIDTNESMCTIPLVASVFPIALVSNCDIKVNEIDSHYANTMNLVKDKYKELYGSNIFDIKINANSIQENFVNSNGSALTFSGGLDAIYSLKEIEGKPLLIMLFGFDIRLRRRKFFMKVKQYYEKFAKNNGYEIIFVETNSREIMNYRTTNADFGIKLYKHTTFWASLQQIPILTGVVAPLSTGRFNKFYIAATDNEETHKIIPLAQSSGPKLDNYFSWADNVQVKSSGYIQRYEKIDFALKFLEQNNLILRSCNVCSYFDYDTDLNTFNCNKCEKCLKTIVSILIRGKNPNDYGFDMNENTLSIIKSAISKEKWKQVVLDLYWKPMQKIIPEKIDNYYFGSEKFFEWFKDAKLIGR